VQELCFAIDIIIIRAKGFTLVSTLFQLYHGGQFYW
jgi:hypothetical protein